MAVRTYRFHLKEPGVTAEQLESDVGVAVAISDDAGGVLIDIDCEEANYSELQAAMDEYGFSFVEGDPITTAQSKFRSLLDLLSIDEHQTIRHLIHFVSEGPIENGVYKETLPTSSPFPTSLIWYNESNPATRKKIVELTITYTGAFPTTEEWKIYDSTETLLATVTDTVSYSGPFEDNVTRSVVFA